MGLSRQSWEDRIRSRLGDLGVLQLVSEEQIPFALEEAFQIFSNDRPRTVAQDFAGDDATYTFDLSVDTAAGWIPDWSRILDLEYPLGQRSQSLIRPDRWRLDGDSSVVLEDTTPATGETLRIRHTAIYAAPDDTPATDLTPAPFQHAIASLAAAKMARWQGAEFARQQSASIGAQLINRDATQLFSAATTLEKAYTDTALGRDNGSPNPIAFAITETETFPDTVFDRRDNFGRYTYPRSG